MDCLYSASANGKFLLTGEYLVLRGAKALALPLRYGQQMVVSLLDGNGNILNWSARKLDENWFSVVLNRDTLEIISTDDVAKGEKLSQILSAVKALNPQAFSLGDLSICTHLEFNPEWGLGSSSTLIANLANWAKIDPYELLRMTFGGSGYDIACASASHPILYSLSAGLPQVTTACFLPSFRDRLFFVYQGKKQSSAKEIAVFKERMQTMRFEKEIEQVSEISESMLSTDSFSDFCALLSEHERIISYCIGREPVQTHFAGFEGTIKSLGAWGGDFFLAASPMSDYELRRYFAEKGLTTVIRYDDIVL